MNAILRPFPWQLRPVAPSDLDVVCAHREAMFIDAGRSPAVVAQMRPSTRQWLMERLGDGRYFGFLAESEGRVVGGVGQVILDWPPHALHPLESRRGYVLNVYVARAMRRRGLARALMEAAEAEFRQRGVQYLVLHASDAGRPLYDTMGWSATNEMAKRLA